MARVVFLTDKPFWLPVSGGFARSLSLTRYLASRASVRVLYFGPPEALAPALAPSNLAVEPIATNGGKARIAELVRDALKRDPCDVCVVDRIPNHFVRDSVPDGVPCWLDAIDVRSLRAESFRRGGLPSLDTTSVETERAIFECYDAILAIQRHEHEFVERLIGPDRAILVPHPTAATRRVVREPARVIGFVGSTYPPNVEGLVWFLSEVWPAVYRPGLTLRVVGSVAQRLRGSVPGVTLLGAVPALDGFYAACDVAINPVRYGSGLKIKTVEALGAALPLVTTSEGARGLEGAKEEPFLIRDEAPAFAAALRGLLEQESERARLAEAAYQFVARALSPEACYSELLRRIELAAAPRARAQS